MPSPVLGFLIFETPFFFLTVEAKEMFITTCKRQFLFYAVYTVIKAPLVLCCFRQVCNGDQYLNIHPSEMFEAWRRRRRNCSLPETAEITNAVSGPANTHNAHFHHINLETLTLPSGSSIRPENIPLPIFKSVSVFYVCANCGKIYWEGSHYDRIHEQFAHILEDSCCLDNR